MKLEVNQAKFAEMTTQDIRKDIQDIQEIYMGVVNLVARGGTADNLYMSATVIEPSEDTYAITNTTEDMANKEYRLNKKAKHTNTTPITKENTKRKDTPSNKTSNGSERTPSTDENGNGSYS